MYESGQNPPDGGPPAGRAPAGEAMMDFAAVTMELIAQRRADPQDDLISLWGHRPRSTAARGPTARSSSECLLLLDGGAETTRTVIGSIIRELALQPDQRQILLDRPEVLGDTAVEEFIRWVTPILNMRRTVTSDHTFRGQELHEGDQVLLMYGVGQPRRAGVRRPRPLRRDPGPQPPRGLRLRHPLLPRLVARPHRDPGDVRGAAAPHPRLAPGARHRAEGARRPRSPAPTTRCTSWCQDGRVPEGRVTTATVLFCDLVGSTAQRTALGDDAADRLAVLARRHAPRRRTALSRFGGQEHRRRPHGRVRGHERRGQCGGGRPPGDGAPQPRGDRPRATGAAHRGQRRRRALRGPRLPRDAGGGGGSSGIGRRAGRRSS